jgi:hypothetical protein
LFVSRAAFVPLSNRRSGTLSDVTGALTLPPSPLCGASLCGHVRMLWSRLGGIPARHLPRRELGLPPTLHRAVVVDDHTESHTRPAQRPHRRVRRAADPPLAACAQQRFAHRPLRWSALAPLDFISMAIGFV